MGEIFIYPVSPHHRHDIDNLDNDDTDSLAPTLIVAMASLPLLLVPEDGTEFSELDDVLLALNDWAVNEKLVFCTGRRDAGRLPLAVPRFRRRRHVGALSLRRRAPLWRIGAEAILLCLEERMVDGAVSRYLSVTNKTSPSKILGSLGGIAVPYPGHGVRIPHLALVALYQSTGLRTHLYVDGTVF